MAENIRVGFVERGVYMTPCQGCKTTAAATRSLARGASSFRGICLAVFESFGGSKSLTGDEF